LPAEARFWPSAAGAWLGIGTAPATLVLGAAMAARHDGPMPVAGLLLGVGLMTALLYGQGRIGLRAPHGDGDTLTAVAPAYLGRVSRTVLTAVLAAAMIGWNGFNVGLGGASLAALLGTPGWAGPVLLGAAVLAVSVAPRRLGNRIAVVTTLSAVALVGFCLFALPAPAAPLRADLDGGPGRALADAAALVGYVAVFAVRAPDFSAGLARRRDLMWCVGLVVAPALLGVLAGIGLRLRSGSADVVAVLSAGTGLAGHANLFVAVAVFAAALTTTYSGALALRGLAPRVPRATGAVVVTVFGTALAVARFDRHLLPWLTLLAAALPVLVVPMATEAVRRRRGAGPRRVPVWCWLPAAVLAVALTAAGRPQAPLVGLAVAAVLTICWRLGTGRSYGRDCGSSPPRG
jgi:purine-cytosine permease-like protein